MASSRTARTSSGVISGFGLAIAKIKGWAAMESAISWVTAPATESPMKQSAPFRASSRVRVGVEEA